MTLRSIDGGVTAPLGFRVASGEAGIRQTVGPDLVLLASDGPASAAATLTTNRMRAAPVLLTAESLATTGGRARAIVINAGCANAGTGAGGLEDARAVVEAAAERVGCSSTEVLPASTGLIGSRLPVEAMRATLAGFALERSTERDQLAAMAIMTTDTRPKQVAVSLTLADGREIRIGGMAKGSGMIHPQMATMLAFLTTDAPIDADRLAAILRAAVEVTFNQVTVDGDTSTNDAVMLLANGQAGGSNLEAGDEAAFADALEEACRHLAISIAQDGEGAHHLIEVRVQGARSDADARRIARTVAGSSLVKTAVHGADPNWGRIAAAAGRAGVDLDAEAMRICIGDIPVYDGSPVDFDGARAQRILAGDRVPLLIALVDGHGIGVAWGCDLSSEYVAINSEYTT